MYNPLVTCTASSFALKNTNLATAKKRTSPGKRMERKRKLVLAGAACVASNRITPQNLNAFGRRHSVLRRHSTGFLMWFSRGSRRCWCPCRRRGRPLRGMRKRRVARLVLCRWLQRSVASRRVRRRRWHRVRALAANARRDVAFARGSAMPIDRNFVTNTTLQRDQHSAFRFFGVRTPCLEPFQGKSRHMQEAAFLGL